MLKTVVYNNKNIRYCCNVDETLLYDPLLVIDRTRDSYIWARGDSQPYVDLLMGYSSTNFGHANKTIVKFVKEAICRYDNLPSFNSREKIDLSKKLVLRLPYKRNCQVYFTVGGAESVETAIKMARTFTKKNKIISFKGGFHGYSVGSISVTDGAFANKRLYGTLPKVSKSFEYPNSLYDTSLHASSIILDKIDNYLKRNGDKVAAIIFEPIQGAAGFIMPPKEFLLDLGKIATKYSVLTICDEIQTGIGRTGSFYYINQLNTKPDIVLLGKSLAGGYYPLGAVIAEAKLFKSMPPLRSRLDATFSNNFLGIAIANKTVDLLDGNLLTQIERKGTYFLHRIKKMRQFEFVQDINGIGLALSLRIESPDKEVIDNKSLAILIKKECFKKHIIIQNAGIHGNYLKISPSFFIGKSLIDSVADTLFEVMDKVNRMVKKQLYKKESK